MPGSLGERVCEAVAEVQSGWMPSFAVSPPAAHRPSGKVCIDRDDVDLGVPEESIGNILSGRPEPGFDDDAQFDPDSSRHQPDKRLLQVVREFIGSRLAEDDRHGR
jgi:hypothetical protein